MTARITALVDRPDNFEIIRDQIAGILVEEIEGQQSLARAANRDPDEFRFRVFTEHSSPWDEYLDPPGEGPLDRTPLINVQWDKTTVDESSSNTVERQKNSATYHLDCYGCGRSAPSSDGHTPGDEDASLEAQRAARFVRSILMAGHYTYLGLKGVVWRRWHAGSQAFYPPQEQRPVRHVKAVRVSLRVDFNEFSPQVEGTPLALITVRITRGLTGEITLFEGSYPQEPTP